MSLRYGSVSVDRKGNVWGDADHHGVHSPDGIDQLWESALTLYQASGGKYAISKSYDADVYVFGSISKSEVERLERGLELDRKPARVVVCPPCTRKEDIGSSVVQVADGMPIYWYDIPMGRIVNGEPQEDAAIAKYWEQAKRAAQERRAEVAPSGKQQTLVPSIPQSKASPQPAASPEPLLPNRPTQSLHALHLAPASPMLKDKGKGSWTSVRSRR